MVEAQEDPVSHLTSRRRYDHWSRSFSQISASRTLEAHPSSHKETISKQINPLVTMAEKDVKVLQIVPPAPPPLSHKVSEFVNSLGPKDLKC